MTCLLKTSLAYEYTLPKAIKEGYLSPIKALTIPLKIDMSSVSVQAGDFKASDISTALDPYLQGIAEEMKKYCQDKKTVVFLPLVKTSQKFRDLLNENGFRAAEVNGDSQDRAEILKDFDSGKYNVLCNSMLLTEGWDCPSVDCIVVLRPTKVRSLYCQMVGRGTRLSPETGKNHLLLLDFLWHTERHELCHPASEIAVANAQRQIAQNPAAEPVVTILWSESPHLKDGQQMPLHEAEAVFKELDSARRHEREQPGYTGHWYDKTKFRIDFTMQGQPDSYEGRQDFGDGDGSLIQHIRGYHEYYAQDESWKNHVLHHEGPEAWEADKAQRDMLLHEFVPYMELHCNLAAMEQEARRPLRSGETLTPEQTAYFNAVLDYVKECRPLLNQGQYHLPEPPQLADFDQSLQDYKKQIEAELEQEAAAAGLTVEEYVASDYEAPAQPNFSIYQVPPGPEGRDFRYRSYEDLQADGLSVDRKNYQLVYTAPLDKDTTLDEIYRRFNIEHPSDYKGHSLSTGDIVVFRQDGKQTAYYVDEGADYRQVPEFFAQPEKQLTPDECMTGEQIQTPRGRFYLTDRSREQMEAAGYGFHHQSEDGRYLIMANGTRAFAIPAQQESHIKTAEMSTEQNYNMIDGMMNNAPSMEELEARAKAGEQISLLDVAEAAKAEAKKPKQTRKTTQKQKKPSIRAQLAAAKEEQKKKPPAREKSKEMEV